MNPTSRRLFTTVLLLLLADCLQPWAAVAAEDTRTPVEPARLEKLVVTGSNLRRTEKEGIQPVTIVPTLDAQLGAVATPLELMRLVPALGALNAFETQDGGRVRGSASSINLRGLGGQNTLILLNGRRLPNYGLPLGGLVFVNVNNLPLAAVERVEILRDGASAVYGADATAGVVNFITRRAADERRFSVRFGDTADGAAAEYRGTLTVARRFPGGRGGLMVVLDAYRRGMLMARDRAFAVRGDARGVVPEPFGSAANWNQLSNIGPYASFTLVTQAGLPSSLPGTGGTAAYVDFGRKLQPGTRPQANYYNDADGYSLVPGRTSRDLFIAADQKLGSRVAVFSEISRNDLVSRVQQSAMTIASTQNIDSTGTPLAIPASNYHNPFGVRFFGPGTANPGIAPRAVQFNYVEPAFGPRVGRITTSQSRLLLGLRGDVGRDWSWELAGLRADNRARDLTTNLLKRSALVTALARSTPDAFNMFGGPDANPEPVLAAIRTDSHIGGRSALSLADARISGSLATLPAGALLLSAGAELREESLRSDNSDIYRAGDLVNTAVQTDFKADRDVRSVHLELSAPLLRNERSDLLRSAELQLAGRWERFPDFGSTMKPRAGIALRPAADLLLRASFGRGFRAPSLAQLYGSLASSMAARVDPFRPQDGNIRRTIFQPPTRSLKPERTESSGAGFVWETTLVPGLAVTVDGWRYALTDQINVVGRDAQLAREVAGGAYSNPNVARVAPSPGVPVGPIVSISEPLANFSRAETSGCDFSASYRVGRRDSGLLVLGAEATYIHSYRVKVEAGQPFVDFPPDLSRPRLRGIARSEVAWRAWSATLSCNHTSRYKPADRITVAGVDYFVPSYTTWNLSAAYRFAPRGPLRGSVVSAGINNLADRDPPAYPTRQGYDARLFSPQGRFAFVNVGFEF